MRGNAGKHVRKPGLRIDAIHFCRDNETIHGRSTLATAIGSAELLWSPIPGPLQTPPSGASVKPKSKRADTPLSDQLRTDGIVIPITIDPTVHNRQQKHDHTLPKELLLLNNITRIQERRLCIHIRSNHQNNPNPIVDRAPNR